MPRAEGAKACYAPKVQAKAKRDQVHKKAKNSRSCLISRKFLKENFLSDFLRNPARASPKAKRDKVQAKANSFSRYPCLVLAWGTQRFATYLSSLGTPEFSRLRRETRRACHLCSPSCTCTCAFGACGAESPTRDKVQAKAKRRKKTLKKSLKKVYEINFLKVTSRDAMRYDSVGFPWQGLSTTRDSQHLSRLQRRAVGERKIRQEENVVLKEEGYALFSLLLPSRERTACTCAFGACGASSPTRDKQYE